MDATPAYALGGLFSPVDPTTGLPIDPLTGLPRTGQIVGGPVNPSVLPGIPGSQGPLPGPSLMSAAPTPQIQATPSAPVGDPTATRGVPPGSPGTASSPIGSADYGATAGPSAAAAMTAPPSPQNPNGLFGDANGTFIPPQSQDKPGLLERLSNAIKGDIQGPTPAGYDQLLTPEQINAARPTLWQTMMEGANGQTFKRNLDEAVQNVNLEPGVIASARLGAYKAQQAMAASQYVASHFAPAAGDTPEQTTQKLQQGYTYLVEHNGDPETIKNLGATIQSTLSKDVPHEYTTSVVNGQTTLYDKTTGQVVKQFTTPPTPLDIKKEEDQHELALAELQRQTNSTQWQHNESAATNFEANPVIKPILTSVTKIMGFRNAMEQAKAGNYTALQPALYGFVSNVDPGFQVRLGLLSKLEDVAPGLINKTNFEINTKMLGQLPAGTMDRMLSLLDGFHSRLEGQYRASWNALVKGNPGIDSQRGDLSPETLFQGDNTNNGNAPAGGRIAGMMQQYGGGQ